MTVNILDAACAFVFAGV